MIRLVDVRNRWESAAHSAAQFYTGQGRSVFPILAAASFGIASLLPGRLDSLPDNTPEWLFWLLFCIGVLCTALGVAAFFVHPSYSELRKENLSLGEQAKNGADEVEKHKFALNTVLDRASRRALEDCGIEQLGDARISVYVDRGNEFVLVSRWALSAELRKPGRASFPRGQGLIGEAWSGSGGAACKNSMSGDRKAWEKEQCDTYDFTPKEAAALTMHSRTVAAVRVDSQNSSPVIVIESLNPKILTVRGTKDLRDHPSFKCIADMLSEPSTDLPSVHEVKQAS